MASYVCPWWAAPLTINTPLRRWLHDPQKIVGPYIKSGMTVMDVGCGMGWFTIPMARMVGNGGKVIAVDLQPKMLAMLGRRAKRAGVADRIEMHNCAQDRLGINAKVDFVLVFAMLHEVPDQDRMLKEIYECLNQDGKLLLAEPPIHVSGKKFDKEVAIAEESGFRVASRPAIRWSRAVLLGKTIKKYPFD